MNPIAEEILMHYGMPRRSGRYPWGSGENPYQHSGDFLSRIDELKSQGMLRITIPSTEFWDEAKQEFVYTKAQTLQLEHSLVSLSKWESRWNKPFLTKQEKTLEETIDYVKCMTLTQNVKPEVYNYLTNSNINEVNRYIALPMTATQFFEEKKSPGSKEQITAELVYYWMIVLNIPFECQKWHLNKLLTLIRVCDIKSRPPKKHSRREIMKRNAALNAARKKKWNTKG